MFEKSIEELKALGANITTPEIMGQPDVWEDAYQIYLDNKEKIEAFLARARKMAGGRLSVIATGAGSSQYSADVAIPYLRECGDTDIYDFKSIATTDIVSAPRQMLRPDDPTLLISFARSGNSPESLATVKIARSFLKNVMFMNITCAPEGALAVESEGREDTLTILIPKANDGGFAMTASYSSMMLMTDLIFDKASDEQKLSWVKRAAAMGREVVSREKEVQAFIAEDYNRVTYVGSGCLTGLARESQLKILELAHGLTATSWDSCMGYRHGPKSFVDNKGLVFVFVSNDAYTRQYDLDILKEINGDGIALKTIAIQQEAVDSFNGTSFTFSDKEALPDAYAALPFIMVAQTVALLNSIKVGNTPDTPSPSGTVNRVVKGVTIHPFNA